MAERPIKMLARKKTDKEAVEVVSQHQKLDVARYLLQVDRQTKGSFQTSEAAQSAALEIKRPFQSFKCRSTTTSPSLPR